MRTLLAVLLLCGLSHAATYYVSPSGLNTHSGLAASCADTANAWQTISKAASTYVAGDTVNVCDGTYNEIFTLSRAGTFQSVNKWGAHIAPTNTSGQSGLIVSISGNSITVKNFDITSTDETTTQAGIKSQGGTTGAQVVGNRIHDLVTTAAACIPGAAIQSGTTNGAVLANYIYNIGEARGPNPAGRCGDFHGIYTVHGGGTQIKNNLFIKMNQGYGIKFASPDATLTGFVIANNTVVNAGDPTGGGSGTPTGGPWLLDCESSGGCSGNTWSNNIFAFGVDQFGFCGHADNVSGVPSGNTYTNNLTFQCGNTPSLGGVDTWQNGVTSNPLFVNYTGDQTGNYHLQPGSPAIMAGTATGSPATDFDGNPQTSPPTIGAYTFISGSAPPTGFTFIIR